MKLQRDNVQGLLLIPFTALVCFLAYQFRPEPSEGRLPIEPNATDSVSVSFDDPFPDADYILNLRSDSGLEWIEVTDRVTGQVWGVEPDSLIRWMNK